MRPRSGGDRETVDATPRQVRALRAYNQCLYRKAARNDLVDVVRALCGVNAQSAPAMSLSLRARIDGLDPVDIGHAIGPERALARTWAMRGTIHLMASDDLAWTVALLGPGIVAKGRRRRRELGLDDDALSSGMKLIRESLAGHGPLTRVELTDRLIDRGLNLERRGQAPYHLFAYAALKGLICMGPERENGDQTYVLAGEWIGGQKAFARDEALACLAHRYICGYGPSGPGDFAAWSGMSLADAKKGWKLALGQYDVVEADVEGNKLWLPTAQLKALDEIAGGGTVVNLLPAFDELVLGYADRGYIVPGEHRKAVYHGGQTVPVVLVDGLAAGVWRYERRGKKLNVKVSLFGRFDRAVKDLVEKEAEDIGRFFRSPVTLTYA